MSAIPESLRRILAAQKPAASQPTRPAFVMPDRSITTIIWRDGQILKQANGRLVVWPSITPIP